MSDTYFVRHTYHFSSVRWDERGDLNLGDHNMFGPLVNGEVEAPINTTEVFFNTRMSFQRMGQKLMKSKLGHENRRSKDEQRWNRQEVDYIKRKTPAFHSHKQQPHVSYMSLSRIFIA